MVLDVPYSLFCLAKQDTDSLTRNSLAGQAIYMAKDGGKHGCDNGRKQLIWDKQMPAILWLHVGARLSGQQHTVIVHCSVGVDT